MATNACLTGRPKEDFSTLCKELTQIEKARVASAEEACSVAEQDPTNLAKVIDGLMQNMLALATPSYEGADWKADALAAIRLDLVSKGDLDFKDAIEEFIQKIDSLFVLANAYDRPRRLLRSYVQLGANSHISFCLEKIHELKTNAPQDLSGIRKFRLLLVRLKDYTQDDASIKRIRQEIEYDPTLKDTEKPSITIPENLKPHIDELARLKRESLPKTNVSRESIENLGINFASLFCNGDAVALNTANERVQALPDTYGKICAATLAVLDPGSKDDIDGFLVSAHYIRLLAEALDVITLAELKSAAFFLKIVPCMIELFQNLYSRVSDDFVFMLSEDQQKRIRDIALTTISTIRKGIKGLDPLKEEAADSEFSVKEPILWENLKESIQTQAEALISKLDSIAGKIAK